MCSRISLRSLALAFILTLPVGCASWLSNAEPPEVSLAGLEIIEVGLFEQRYRLKLRIQNPNDFALPIRGMDYELALNDKKFARGVSNQSVTVPAFGEDLVEVGVVSNLTTILDQLRGFAAGNGSLSYRLSGEVSLLNRSNRLPFEYKGELALPAPEGPAGEAI